MRKFLSSQTADLSTILELSARYGELDGELSYYYATTFSQVYNTMTDDQKADLLKLADDLGYLPPEGGFLYSEPIPLPEISSTDFMFR